MYCRRIPLVKVDYRPTLVDYKTISSDFDELYKYLERES